MNLRKRFTIFIGGVVMAVVAVHTGVLLAAEFRSLWAQAEESHWKAARSLGRVCNEAAINRDDLGALNFFRDLRAADDFIEGMCLDGEGRAWLHSDLNRIGERIPLESHGNRPWKSVDEQDRERWVYGVPMARSGKGPVYARLVCDGGATRVRVHGLLVKTARRTAWVSTVVLGVALLLAWGTARALTKPILDLTAGSQRLGRGDWNARVPLGGPGELGQLAGEFNRMAEKLGELDRLKDQFLHSVSHDLRNPLGALSTSAKMMRARGLPEDLHPLIDTIESASMRLNTMVGNLLDMARLREGGLPYDRRVFPIQPMLTELKRFYQPLADESGRTVVLEISGDLPPLHADQEKVFRVFLNVLNNAFKFTRDGDRITIAAKAETGAVRFHVADTGRGIPADRMARLFEPFQPSRGGNERPRQGEGTGLGLAIVKTFVEGHGGRLRVDSAEGVGTTVAFSFPTESVA